MDHKLSEMSLEELWKLFPIILTAHQESWKIWYEEERNRLISFLPGDAILRISHIGSTAIPDIHAKPTVDILLEVKDQSDFSIIGKRLAENGYACMSESSDRISFNKGYTEQGFAERVFHLHLRLYGDNDELYFRDYLNDHPEIAKEYEALKLTLRKKYEHNRDAYTDAKGEFITKYTEEAKSVFPGRY